ncbi:MAG: D-alanine--D-alanine ligase, partial [Alphaproteobacteria bacterium]|nr:D-alanine--D-alanine ligase [Alphaproteobacteria bacterium]
MTNGTHVAVLMGGWSAEREVSLVSGAAVATALDDAGYQVSTVDVGRDVSAVLDKMQPDVAFNALHGRWGEDGCVQGLLEVLGIPYTHSGVLASAVAMDKPVARQMFSAAGIRCPEGRVMSRSDVLAGGAGELPIVVKPLNEGSSVGVLIVFNDTDLAPLGADDWAFGDDVLVERYIAGREVQVAVMGERVLGAIEIRPKGRFYDYETKYTEGKADHFMPAPIHANAYAEALEMALDSHRALGCRGISRADLRYDDTDGEPGTLYMLE